MSRRTSSLVLSVCFGIASASCGEISPQQTAPLGSGKADAPTVIVAIDTDRPLTPTMSVTNQGAEALWVEPCRHAWWERKVVEPATAVVPDDGELDGDTTGEDDATDDATTAPPRVRWEPAGPAQLGCEGDADWWDLDANVRTAIDIDLPTAAGTANPEDRTPAPGTYRLAVAVLDDGAFDASMVGVVRSREIVLRDVTAECETVCTKVNACQTAAGETFAAAGCNTWCKSMLTAARTATATDCGACFDQQACGDVLLDPSDPYDDWDGNPGLCRIECRLGSCETDAECAAGQSCSRSFDWATYATSWECSESQPSGPNYP